MTCTARGGGRGVRPRRARDTGEVYDCVIVGAGASGVAAAKFYQDRFGADSKILLLDAMDDVGGHSARNRFELDGLAGDVTILRNGGTVNLDSIGTWAQATGGLLDIPASYGQPALDVLDWCGVDVDSFPDNVSNAIPSSFGLRAMLLFPSVDWGSDTLARNRVGSESWPDFVARLPFSPAAREAIVRIQTDQTSDWIGLAHGDLSEAERRDLLTRITYKQWLTDYLGAPEEAIVQYQRNSHGLLGAGAQAVSALDMWLLGSAGFSEANLLGDPTEAAIPGMGRTPQMATKAVQDPTLFWPDGNASLVRLMLSNLVPPAVPDVGGARPDQQTIVQARVDYSQLDLPSNGVRVRLQSFVFNVNPGDIRRGSRGRERMADVDYLHDGVGYRVKGRHVVMACWNRVTARVVRGLPRQQVADLCYRAQGTADLRTGGAAQLAGVRRCADRLGVAARGQPVLGLDRPQRRRLVR